MEEGEGITLPHLPQRRAALTWCEHANGLTSTATPGFHTHTYSTDKDTHRARLTQKQDADNNKAHQSASY